MNIFLIIFILFKLLFVIVEELIELSSQIFYKRFINNL